MWKPGQIVTINHKRFRVTESQSLLVCPECRRHHSLYYLLCPPCLGEDFNRKRCIALMGSHYYPKLITPKQHNG